MFVFILFHVHEMNPGEDDEKLIGVYSTAEAAEAARNRARQWPGFKDDPEGFIIDRYQLDEDHWTDGYFTFRPGDDDQTSSRARS